jgi:hypothetical protein
MTDVSGETALEFDDQAQFGEWLQGKPRDWAVALAARAALRVAPLVSHELRAGPDAAKARERFLNLTGVVFRAAAIGRLAGAYPTHPIAATAAANSAFAAADTANTIFANAVVVVAAVANGAAADTAADTAAVTAAVTAAAADTAAAWRALSADARRLVAQETPADLARAALWPEGASEWAKNAWTELLLALPKDQHWEVWIDWYQARLDGKRWPKKKELIYVDVPKEVWDQGHVAANTWIYDELQKLKRKKPPSDPPPEAQTDIAEQRPAPVSFRIVDGKIDAAPEDAIAIDVETAEDFYAEAKRKAQDLRERLARAQADRLLQDELATLERRLGASLGEMRLGPLLSSLTALEKLFALYDSEEGRKEHSLEAIAALGGVAAATRDLAALYPKARLIEAEAIAFDLVRRPEAIPVVEAQTERIVNAAQDAPFVTQQAAEQLAEPTPSIANAQDIADKAKQLSYRQLSVENFARAMLAIAVKEGGGLLGDCWKNIRETIPPTVGKVARISLYALSMSALTSYIAHEKITTLKEIGEALREIDKATNPPAENSRRKPLPPSGASPETTPRSPPAEARPRQTPQKPRADRKPSVKKR